MKKMKQLLAIIGIILILGVNVLLIVTAGSSSEGNTNAFNGAIVAVVLVPVLLWIYLYIYKLIKQKNENKDIEKELDEE